MSLEVAVLVPVLGRPAQVRAVASSLRSSSRTRHRLLFICSPSDTETIAVCREVCQETDAGVHVVDWLPGPGDFARKTNRGFELTSEPYVFCGASDLTFQPGWDVEALKTAKETGAGVIGTWDGANPAVKAGRHSTHSLVRRSYAEDPGCTMDGTGAIYCELYDHQCVDNELIEVAQMRGEWAFARRSRVLHHHPIFDRSVAMDATYTKALARGREDRALFLERRRRWIASSRRPRQTARADR